MKNLLLLGVLWTYGSETLDNMIKNTNTEYFQFMQMLNCTSHNNEIVCIVDGIKYSSNISLDK